jgi:N-acetylglutamate synthase-like GNAT family acetyltransferase
MIDNLELRRARIGDVAAITSFIQRAARSRIRADEAEVTAWLFGKGLWVAFEDGTLVGVAAWQAENLVSVTDLFCVFPKQALEKAGRRLLETIEAEASTLMCEINVVLLPGWALATARTFLRQQGYESRALPALHRIWREVLSDFATEEQELMVKKLRDRMVMVPV